MDENAATLTRAVRATSTGGPEVLELGEIELPPLAPGQARVRVHRTGVNFWDVMQRRGIVPLSEQGVPGIEGVGIVEAVGTDVDRALLGTRVAWSKLTGSYAELVQGDAAWLLPVPDELDDDVAASVLMQGVTADYLIEAAPALAAGDVAVLMAASGGVGTLLTQLLAAAGVKVAGVVSRDEKVARSRDAGADEVFVDGDDLVERVRAAYPGGARVVFDSNGGSPFPRNFELCGPRGGVVTYGSAAGPPPPLDLGLLAPGSLSVHRVAGGDFAGDPASYLPRAQRVLDGVVAGRIRPYVDRIAPLHEAADQHRYLESRRSTGKLLLHARDTGPSTRWGAS